MKLYRDNRIDQPFELTAAEISEGFWRDNEPADIGNLDRALRLWLAGRGSWDPDNPTDDSAYTEVLEATLASWPTS
jgi:hypothetical protein